MDDIPASPLCRWLLFSRVSQWMFPGLRSVSTSATCTGSVGKASRPLECNTRALACLCAPALGNTQEASMGFSHLSRSWCTSSGFLGGTGSRYSEHLHLSINFLATWCQGPWYPTGPGDEELQQRVKQWLRDHRPLLYFPSGGATSFHLQDYLSSELGQTGNNPLTQWLQVEISCPPYWMKSFPQAFSPERLLGPWQ